MSLRWKQAEAPSRAAERGAPASAGFSEQLVAVLPRLRRFARGLAGSAAEADDLVQAACERALARSHQFQEGTRFDSWMFRIVQTIWIDQLRARDVRKEDGDVAVGKARFHRVAAQPHPEGALVGHVAWHHFVPVAWDLIEIGGRARLRPREHLKVPQAVGGAGISVGRGGLFRDDKARLQGPAGGPAPTK